jgi:hypothetical protein
VDIPLFFKLEATVIVWLGAAAVTDVIIAVALVLHFVCVTAQVLRTRTDKRFHRASAEPASLPPTRSLTVSLDVCAHCGIFETDQLTPYIVAIETGALTSIVAVLNIIAFVVSKVSRITLGV